MYNSKLIFGGHKHNFVLAAKQLLEAVFGERKECPDRPIIFIGHSLGGLLIGQAIINVHQSHRYRPLKDAISTVIFFRTPHEGGNKALVDIGSAAAKVARFLGAQKNPDIEKTFVGGSLFSDIRQFYFQNRLLELMIVSFWEGEGDVSETRSSSGHSLTFQADRIKGRVQRLVFPMTEKSRLRSTLDIVIFVTLMGRPSGTRTTSSLFGTSSRMSTIELLERVSWLLATKRQISSRVVSKHERANRYGSGE